MEQQEEEEEEEDDDGNTEWLGINKALLEKEAVLRCLRPAYLSLMVIGK